MNPVPAVDESRSSYRAAAALKDPPNPPAGGKARVGFWNLTGRDVVLRVDGQTYAIGAGQNLKLELGRTFVWKVDQYEAQVEQMPAAAPSMELVIRR
jgi:hypothetical protein